VKSLIKIIILSLFFCINPVAAAQKTPIERMASIKKAKLRNNSKQGCWDCVMNTSLIIFASLWFVGTTCAIMDRFATQKAKAHGDGAPIVQQTSHLIQNPDLGQNVPVPMVSRAQNSASSTALNPDRFSKKTKKD